MPAVFIGHGSPAIALEKDEFNSSLLKFFSNLKPMPKAIIALSAHWLTQGNEILVTGKSQLNSIYDFFGFPAPLYDLKYEPQGDFQLAEKIQAELEKNGFECSIDFNRGIDHGVWIPLLIGRPQCDFSVVEVSIPNTDDAKIHFKLGQSLGALLTDEVLLLGSGNLIHNLGEVYWDEPRGEPIPWAQDFENWFFDTLKTGDWEKLFNWRQEVSDPSRIHPSPEHFYPVFSVLGACQKRESLKFIYQGFHNRSVSMTSFSFDLV
ncbi:MAG: class III extradiol ring-cleavage dioxygenase [Pseudomonadota bacterium]|nr:class III extradiol ring-cleavage dioxygenase [Pseudomonadota bacterium]